MTHRLSTGTALFITLTLFVALPALAEAIRPRPVGPYKYTMNYSYSFQGQTETGHKRGRLKLSGRRMYGRSLDGEHSFNFRIAERILDVTTQDATARGGRFTTDFGSNRSRVKANIRVQKTRRGSWKVSASFSGVTAGGPDKGRRVSGKITAHAI